METGAEVLATSCPYCISNFEESRLAARGGTARGQGHHRAAPGVARGREARRERGRRRASATSWSWAAGSAASRPRSTSPRRATRSSWSRRRRPSAGRWRSSTRPSPPTTARCASSRPSSSSATGIPNIEILTYTEVDTRRGPGRRLRGHADRKPRYVNEDLCTGCTTCAEYCPVNIPDPFNQELSTNKADAHLLLAGRSARALHRRRLPLPEGREVLHLRGRLQEPGDRPPPEARKEVVKVGAIVLVARLRGLRSRGRAATTATGTIENVVTSLDFERLLCATGPARGRDPAPLGPQAPEARSPGSTASAPARSGRAATATARRSAARTSRSR